MHLMILDGNSIINRAYYGVRPLTTRDGMYTNAIFGFLNILQRLLQEEQPDALCVAFDRSGPTFRHQQYAAYKGTRKGMPEELRMQLPVMKEILQAMHIPVYETDGYEADDILGTVARRCGQAGWACTIVTGDRDALQLVDAHATVLLVLTKGGQTSYTHYDEATFQAEYGFAPPRLVDLKALMGDSSDNIPGVPGVGQKGAMALLQAWGSLEGIYANLASETIRPALRKKLEAGQELAQLSYALATICREIPLDFAPEENLLQPWDRPALYELFLKLEFVKMIDRYHLRPEAAPAVPQAEALAVPAVACTVVTGPIPETWPADWQAAERVLLLPTADLSGVALLWGEQVALLAQACTQDYEAALAQLFAPEVRKVAHGVKALQRQLLEMGLGIQGFVFDTELAAYFLDASAGSYALEKLSIRYLSQELGALQPELPQHAQPELVTGQLQTLAQLEAHFRQQLQAQGMEDLYYGVDLPLCQVLAQMEHSGVLVDRQALVDFGQMLSERIATLQEEIYANAGHSLNINSSKQLQQVLFEELGLVPARAKKTKTGYSTSIDVLNQLRGLHPIVQQIIDYRALTKLKSTYADGLLKVIGPDGRIHTTFQNTVTATGRLSSTEPNLQNIPIRTELGGEIRKMFIPQPGWVLVDADYSQIELRVLADLAGDVAMQQAFRTGEDIHQVTASQVFGVAPEQVTAEMRRHAKAVNFGIVYGISEYSLSEDIGVSYAEAKAYIRNYLNQYAGVKAYMQSVVQDARASGYVATRMGRRRALPELHSSNHNVRAAAERMALNTPVQGTAADIIKLAMCRVAVALEAAGLEARLILQVHDELIVEAPEAEAQAVCQLVQQEMERVCALAVPLLAEAKLGKTWYDAK